MYYIICSINIIQILKFLWLFKASSSKEKNVSNRVYKKLKILHNIYFRYNTKNFKIG